MPFVSASLARMLLRSGEVMPYGTTPLHHSASVLAVKSFEMLKQSQIDKGVFARNISKLRGKSTLNGWCARHGLSQPTLQRIVAGKRQGELATVYQVAEAAGIEPWQAVHPNLGFSAYAGELARLFDALPASEQPRVYAVLLWVLEHASGPAPDGLPPGAPPRLELP